MSSSDTDGVMRGLAERLLTLRVTVVLAPELGGGEPVMNQGAMRRALHDTWSEYLGRVAPELDDADVSIVRSLGAEDNSVVASTTLALDGDVVIALRPEVLFDPPALARHLADLRSSIEHQLKRLRRANRALATTRSATIGATVGTSATSAHQLAMGEATAAIWWLAGALGGLLARWLLPKLVGRLLRGWLRHRTVTGTSTMLLS